MKNKSMFILLVGLLFTVLFLSACGSGNEDTTNQSEQDNLAEEVEIDESAEEDGGVEEEVGEDTSNEETSDANEEEEEQAEETTDNQDDTESEPQVVLENEAFRIFEPAPNSEVGNEFTVRGEARVFEAVVTYEFEDGHFILDEGIAMTSQGAPDWGEFEITIQFDELSNDTGRVFLYEQSQKDGSRQHEIEIPVTHKKD